MPKTSAVILHVCGNTNPIMEDLCSLGADALSIDSIASLPTAMEAAQGKMTIMGNVPTELFVTGTMEEMEGAVKECFESTKGKGKFMIFPGCQIPWNATMDRIKGYMDLARRYAEQYA
jgi:uroporphyrinogen-III decarboxylase